ncbi:MAG: MBL fold metallo-hydrolase [Calditrichia bacterium]
MKNISITILSENRVENPLLIAEQGLSLFISIDNSYHLLFDTGQGSALLHNAKQLKIDLSNVNNIVISHGHYDHGNGLIPYLKTYHKANLVVHPFYFNKKYVLKKSNKHFIGVNYGKEELEQLGASIEFHNNPYFLTDEAIFSGEIKRITDFEKISANYVERVLESDINDQIKDDASIYIKTPEGLIILVGCAHSGVINTIKHAIRISGEKRVFMVMGGMHLRNQDKDIIEKTAKFMADLDPQYIIPLHCTGFEAIKMFRQYLGEKKVLLKNVGDTLKFEFE